MGFPMQSKSNASDEFGKIVWEYPCLFVALSGLWISEAIHVFAPARRNLLSLAVAFKAAVSGRRLAISMYEIRPTSLIKPSL